ncbi:MAG: hypothetical protein QNJ46_32020 [Leptolyngbyaceae cyanobacterium MO_188.B28]|nr:hypothetical protein [Leptolyngbyaceae cyanobacterium MO_188.B28]
MNVPLFPSNQFDQVVLADLKHFQIAAPTTARLVKHRVSSTCLSVPERTYGSQGWLICNQQIVAIIQGLEVGAVFSDGAPFKSIKRLSVAIPISFKTKAVCPLPRQVSSQAVLACQFPSEVFPYRAVFQKVAPRFVRIYSFEASSSLLDYVDQMLGAEASKYHQDRFPGEIFMLFLCFFQVV